MDFHGIIPYLVSPVDPDGKIREGVLRRLVDDLIAAGVHGLSPLGSTGEAVFLSFEQRVEIVQIVTEQAAGRVPVIPGVAAYSVREAARQAEAFARKGADGLVAILQVMFPLNRTGLLTFYRELAHVTALPLVIYTNPGLYGVDPPLDVIEELSVEPCIRYIKDASGNTSRIQSLINRCAGRLKVFSASAHLPAVVFQLGGVGWMSGPACVIPRQCVTLYDLCRAGQWGEAYALQARLWPVVELFQKHGLAAFVKAALNSQDYEVGDPLAPQSPLELSPLDLDLIRSIQKI